MQSYKGEENSKANVYVEYSPTRHTVNSSPGNIGRVTVTTDVIQADS